MENEINLLKDNDTITDSDLEMVEEFYRFLIGQKMSPKKAYAIIYYLEEFLPVFPDTIEQCWNCKNLFDLASSGLYWETKDRHYCGSCADQVPTHYDRGRK